MSSWRDELVERAARAIDASRRAPGLELKTADQEEAEAVVDALLPQITDPAEVYQLPQWSIVVFPVMGSNPSRTALQIMMWDGARLQGDLRIDGIPQIPEKVIELYGPLAVLWRPDA